MIRKMIMNDFMGVTRLNQGLRTKDKKQKWRFRGLVLLVLYIFIVAISSYVFQLSYMLDLLQGTGQEIQLLALGIIATLFLCLSSAWKQSANILFSGSDLPLWLSAPIPRWKIVLGKTLIGYLFEVAFSLFFMIPPLILVGNALQLSLPFYIFGVIGAILLPIPAYILGTLLGLLTQRLFKGGKKSPHWRTLLLLILTFGITIGSFFVAAVDWSQVSEGILTFLSVSTTLQLITTQYIEFVLNPNIAYVFIQIGAMAVFVWVVNHKYYVLIELFKSRSTTRGNQKAVYTGNSQLTALYKREFKRYFSSSIYVLNTIFGEVLLILFTVYLFIQRESAQDVVEMVGAEFGVQNMSLAIMAVLISGIIALSPTTNASISLEGKQFPLLKSFPTSVMTIFKAKMAVNLTLALPTLALCLPVIIWILPFTLVEAILCIWLSVAYVLFSTLFGLFINLLLPQFDWEVEATVVKRSLASFISVMGILLFVAGPPIIAIQLLSVDLNTWLFGVALFMTVLNGVLYMLLKTIGVNLFYRAN